MIFRTIVGKPVQYDPEVSAEEMAAKVRLLLF